MTVPGVPDTPVVRRRDLRERERAAEAAAIPTRDSRRSARTSATRASGPRPTARRSTRGATPSRGSRARSVGSRLLSFGAMLFAGALAIGMSVPANAFDSGVDTLLASTAEAGPAQTVEVNAASLAAAAEERDAWSVTSWAEMLRLRYGNRDFSYTVGTGPIRWPFPYAVPISSGFGARVAPCARCSTYHEGIDFTPGYGAPIYAIADGIVTQHEDGYSEYGNFVVITHQIDGVAVESLYAHMQHGSSPLNVGDVIKVGDFVGLVGETGQATGPHLHFEIRIDGVKVDPYAWLKAHAS